MAQEGLGGLTLLSIEKEEASSIDCSDLIAEFAARKSRKVDFM
jgi:hypothetical protein